MTFPNVLKQVWHMDNSDLNVIGEHLGYTWNQVCDAISEDGFYAEDGDSTITVTRSRKNDYSNDAIINAIMCAIFTHHPEVQTIHISN